MPTARQCITIDRDRKDAGVDPAVRRTAAVWFTIRNVSYLNEPPAQRGRPRDAELERRITTTVLELLAEEGYEGVTFEAVARRCQASKATLYRRWPSKRDMVLAAVKDAPAHPSAVPLRRGDTLRDDLLMLAQRLSLTMSATDSNAAFMLLHAGLEDPELCDAIEETVGPTGARLPQAVLDDAVARGELPSGAQSFAYEEVVGTVLLLRRANGLTVDDTYLEALVDTVIIPALIASAGRTDLPAGIFSGHPETSTTTTTTETP